MKKRVFLILMSLILVLAPVLGAGAAQVTEEEAVALEAPYTDVQDPNAWYYEPVQYVYEKGLMTGMSPTVFGVSKVLSRAQFAVILWRMNGSPAMEYTNKFPDVAENTWYTDAALWASEAGIITGYQSGSKKGCFGPADDITREQMAVMMYRYGKYCEYDVSQTTNIITYRDAYKVSPFALEAMKWAVAAKIITGKQNGTMLDPQGKASRAECATIIMRFMKMYVDVEPGEDNPGEENPDHPELAAYKKYLSDDNWIAQKAVSATKEMAVFDLNNDGVYEAAIKYASPTWNIYTTAVLAYNDGIKIYHKQSNKDSKVAYPLSYISETIGRYVLESMTGDVTYDFWLMSKGATTTNLKSITPSQMDVKAKIEYKALSTNLCQPVYVEINETNLAKYLSGDGEVTGIKTDKPMPSY